MGKIKNKSKPLQALIAALFAVLLACTPAIAMADMVGIDVSGWQASNVTCTASYDFAVVKVSQGVGFENSSWRTQAKCVTDRGKSLGLYHYAGGNNAEAEADYFVGRARDYIGRAVLVLDWESYQNAQWGNSDWVRRFVQRVHTLTGVWPMVYVQASALGQIPGDVRANCGLWVAQYASNAPTGYQSRPWNYAIYGEAMRQYSGTGVVNTWSPIDLNVFRGDAWQWDLYANPAGGSAPPATPAAPAQPSDPQPTPNTGGISHVMQWGETIWGLAVAYDAWPLSAWHTPSGDINRYYVGDVVTYGGGTAPASSTGVSKVLQWGDTVWDFATSHGYSVSQCTVPSGNINVYYVGDVVTCR